MNKYFTVIIAAFIVGIAAFGCGKKAAQEAPMSITVEPTTNLITKTGIPVETTANTPALEEVTAEQTPAIEEIQEALKNAGVYTGSVDGKLGPMTKKAVTAFQQQNGLAADGKVGPRTWEKLKTYLNQQ